MRALFHYQFCFVFTQHSRELAIALPMALLRPRVRTAFTGAARSPEFRIA